VFNGAVNNSAVYRLCFIFQSLYGPRKSNPQGLCSNTSFDATFEYPAGVIYVLKGELNTKYCKIRISHSSAAKVLSGLECVAVLVGDFDWRWFKGNVVFFQQLLSLGGAEQTVTFICHVK
jgi:hypothetical protein